MQLKIQAIGSNFGARRAPAAAGINTIKSETVHKSTFALMGQAVPVSAFAALTGTHFVKKFEAGPLHAFFIAASGAGG